MLVSAGVPTQMKHFYWVVQKKEKQKKTSCFPDTTLGQYAIVGKNIERGSTLN